MGPIIDRNFDIEPIQRVDAETLGHWKNLARHVRDELAGAGIPVRGILMPEGDRDWVWEGASDNSDRSAGAGIAIDPEKFPHTAIDEESIWIDWQPDQELLDVVFELILKVAEKQKSIQPWCDTERKYRQARRDAEYTDDCRLSRYVI